MDVGINSRARLLALAGCVFLLVTAVGFGFDLLLHKEGVTRTDILLTSNALTGIVAGALFYVLSHFERERRRFTQQRLQTIADMNHHIRNALQVITYVSASGKRDDNVRLIHDSVDRIEWALREVLPGHKTSTPEQPKPEEIAQS